jgi:hypothetical protein
MILALNLTVRANTLDTLRRQFRLLLGNGIRQSLAYFGICEDPLAVFTGEAQLAIARLSRPAKGVRIHKFVYPFVTRWLSGFCCRRLFLGLCFLKGDCAKKKRLGIFPAQVCGDTSPRYPSEARTDFLHGGH